MGDVVEVEAVPVEDAGTALARPEMPAVTFIPANIKADFGAMLAWAQAIRAEYEAAQFEGVDGYREAKAARAVINNYIKEIKASRKSVEDEYSAPLKAFKERVDQVTGALEDASDVCDRYAKGWEAAKKAEKYEAIRAEYEDFAPLLAPVLPFERFYELRIQAGRKWMNAKPELPRCLDELREDVGRVAGDWEAVEALQTGHPDVAKREFFRTLDLGQAMRAARAADEEDARIAAMRAEQERMRVEAEAARREAQKAADGRASTEAEERARAEAEARERAAQAPEPLPPMGPSRVPLDPGDDPAVMEVAPVPVEAPTWTVVIRDLSEGAAREFEAQLREWFGARVQMYKGEPMQAAIQMGMRR